MRRIDNALETHQIFYQMIRDYEEGRLGSSQHYYRARVEAVDPVGGQLDANPPNPPRSVRARIYTSGLDVTTPSSALTIFHPIGVGCPNPGEHVVVVFEDPQMTSGFWLSVVPSFHDQNYANPDFRESSRSDSSYVFEGDSPRSTTLINPPLEYGGSTTETQGRQEMVDLIESDANRNPWRTKRVLLLGDSQVAGPFGARLGEKLRGEHEASYFAREGRVGWGVYSWLSGRLRRDSPQMPSLSDVISQHNPDIIVISLGGNDGSSGAARRTDYEQKVSEIYNLASNSANLVIWSGPPTATPPNSSKQPGREIAARKIRQVVQQNFVDVFSVTRTTEGRSRDGIHFTPSSPALNPWAEEVIQAGYRLSND